MKIEIYISKSLYDIWLDVEIKVNRRRRETVRESPNKTK